MTPKFLPAELWNALTSDEKWQVLAGIPDLDPATDPNVVRVVTKEEVHLERFGGGVHLQVHREYVDIRVTGPKGHA